MENKKKKKIFQILSVVIVLLMVTITIYLSGGTKLATTYVNIMVNPNIEFELDRNDEVVGVNALNAEAEVVLYDLELVGLIYDNALDVLVDELVELGHIVEGDFENQIIISVVDDEDERREVVEEKTLAMVSEKLEAKNIYAVIHYLDVGTELKENAEDLGISVGHMITVERAYVMLEGYEKEDLIDMSIREIKALIKDKAILNEDSQINLSDQKEMQREIARNRVNGQTPEAEEDDATEVESRRPEIERREVREIEPLDRRFNEKPETIPEVEGGLDDSVSNNNENSMIPEGRGR